MTHANTRDLEIIMKDFIENNPINNDTFYNESETELLNEIILHTFKQFNDIKNEELESNIIDQIDELLLQHIKVAQPFYSDSQLLFLKDKLSFLEKLPQPEQRTPEWYEFRNNRLTASDLYYITSQNKSKIIDIVKKKCGVESNYSPGAAILHGVKFESVATRIYELREKVIITEFGCLPHLTIPFFGASPDGICSYESENKNYVGRMLEIKCPKSRPITGIIPPVYFGQVQGQLEVCDLEYCDFLECQLREYSSKNDFFADTHHENYLLRENGNEKGVIVEVYDLNDKKTKYHYTYDNFRTVEDFNLWEESIIDTILEDSNLEYNKTTFWKMEIYNVVLVKRNKEWFTNNYSKIADFWDNVLESRLNKTYEIDISKSKSKSKSKSIPFVKKYNVEDDFKFLD
jgi:putative phage-type endonuclease